MAREMWREHERAADEDEREGGREDRKGKKTSKGVGRTEKGKESSRACFCSWHIRRVLQPSVKV